jgi:aromatic ring hydroxylase
MIFDQVLVPWENVFVHGDVKINELSRYDRFATLPVNGTPRPA